jgi:hypothetical protein
LGLIPFKGMKFLFLVTCNSHVTKIEKTSDNERKRKESKKAETLTGG